MTVKVGSVLYSTCKERKWSTQAASFSNCFLNVGCTIAGKQIWCWKGIWVLKWFSCVSLWISSHFYISAASWLFQREWFSWVYFTENDTHYSNPRTVHVTVIFVIDWNCSIFILLVKTKLLVANKVLKIKGAAHWTVLGQARTKRSFFAFICQQRCSKSPSSSLCV